MSSIVNQVKRIPRKLSGSSTRTTPSINRQPYRPPSSSNSTFPKKGSRSKLTSTSLLTRSTAPESIKVPSIPSLLPTNKKKSSNTVIPIRIKPSIVYEDSKYIVINKASGVAIQGVYGSFARISWDQLLEDLRARNGCEEIAPVHRLDRGTTGCLVFAKSSGQAKKLSSQFQSHDVHKNYLAVVNGFIETGLEGEITSRLRVDDDCVRVCEEEDVNDGSPAFTKWKCLSSSPNHSLIQFTPTTGRKHQIRVHAAETLKASIVGDFKYAANVNHKTCLNLPSDTMLLHASTVSFYTWDKVGKRSTVEAKAKPPSVFIKFCEEVGLSLPKKGDPIV